MTFVSIKSDRENPGYIELIEDRDNEGKDLFIQAFIDNGMYCSTITEDDCELEASDFLSEEEIEDLKELENTLVDAAWDVVTVSDIHTFFDGREDMTEVA